MVVTRRSKKKKGEGTIPESLDIFSGKITQIATNDGFFQITPCANEIEASNNLVFRIVSADDKVIDPNNTFIAFRCKIVREDGQDIPEKEGAGTAAGVNHDGVVFPPNALGSSVFKNCEVTLNNKVINTCNNLYPYKSYIKKLLFTSRQDKYGVLTMAGHYPMAQPFDDCTEISEAATAIPEEDFEEKSLAQIATDKKIPLDLVQRLEFSRYSSEFGAIDRIYEDLFEQTRYLPTGTKLKLVFTMHDTDFMLLSKRKQKYKFKFTKAVLLLKYVDIKEDVLKDMRLLSAAGCDYKLPISKTQIMYYTRLRGSSELNQPTIFSGPKPRLVIVGLVDQDAFFGSKLKEPFNFQHFDLQEISLHVNGNGRPISAIRCNFAKKINDYALGLWSLYQVVGGRMDGSGVQHGLTMHDFANGNALYGFPLTGTGEVSNQPFELGQDVNIDLNITLASPSKHGICVIVYAEYDSQLEITASGKISEEKPKDGNNNEYAGNRGDDEAE